MFEIFLFWKKRSTSSKLTETFFKASLSFIGCVCVLSFLFALILCGDLWGFVGIFIFLKSKVGKINCFSRCPKGCRLKANYKNISNPYRFVS